MRLVYVGATVSDTDQFDRFHTGNCELIGVSNSIKRPLAEIGNEWLATCPHEVFGLCHADAVFGLGALDAFAAEAMRGAVCGIVGVDLQGVYHCSYNSDRDRWWKGNMRIAEPGEVSTLDGMAVFFRRDLCLQFDAETFHGLHCHVEDLCLQAHARGIPVTVPAADAHHRNHETNQAWLREYQAYRAKLSEKWAGTEFRTT